MKTRVKVGVAVTFFLLLPVLSGPGPVNASFLGSVNLPTHGYLPDPLNGFAGPVGTHFDRNAPLPGVAGGTLFELFPGPLAPPSNSIAAIGGPCGARWFPGFGGGQICRYGDPDFSPGTPYHFEVEITGPTPFMNVFLFTPAGFGGGTLVPIPAGGSVLLEVQAAELFLEVGFPLYTWAFSTVPAPILATWSLTENPADPASAPGPIFGLFGCPVVVGAITCGGFGDDPWAPTFDPSLPGFFNQRPEDFGRLLSAVPAPMSLMLLGGGLAGLAMARRRKRSS